MASTFSTEIWVKPESSRNSSTSRLSETKPSSSASQSHPASPAAAKKHNLLYRIFHMGEDEPRSDSSSPFSSIFNRIQLHNDDNSGSELEEKNTKPPLIRRGSSAQSSKSSLASRKSSINKGEEEPVIKAALLPLPKPLKNTFNFNSDSDSESDLELSPSLPPKRRSTTSALFKDLLTSARSRKQHQSSDASSNGMSSDEDNHSQVSSASHDNLFKGLILDSRYKKTGVQNTSSPSLGIAGSLNLDQHISSDGPPIARSASETSLAEKYGKKENIIGRGGHAVVRLCCGLDKSKKFAVKEFRKRRKEETQREYVKKLVAEFCISSSLDNPHIVKTVDLIQDEKHNWCVVMEFCSGGDLYSKIHDSPLTDPNEINCYFKQLIHGVQYLHSMGVAHRDLKPENLLLDSTRKVLKISDFGVSEVFRTPFASMSQKCHGCAGSGPYIAPEEYSGADYDAELIDVWAIGIIFWVMLFNNLPWVTAQLKCPHYKYYVEHFRHFYPLDSKLSIPSNVRQLMYSMLTPKPEERASIKKIMENDWFVSINVCVDEKGVVDNRSTHSHSTKC